MAQHRALRSVGRAAVKGGSIGVLVALFAAGLIGGLERGVASDSPVVAAVTAPFESALAGGSPLDTASDVETFARADLR